jgi:surface polysaccharide O-acyltransferase-like enzyme
VAQSGLYPHLRWLATRSFAVYLIHPLALHGFRYAVPAPDDLLLRVLFYTAGCGLLTALGVAVLRRIPHGDRVLGIGGRPVLPGAVVTRPRPTRGATHAEPASAG